MFKRLKNIRSRSALVPPPQNLVCVDDKEERKEELTNAILPDPIVIPVGTEVHEDQWDSVWLLFIDGCWLDAHNLCSLRGVNKHINKFIIPILQQIAYFRIPKHGKLTSIVPQRVIVSSIQPIPPSATHVYIPEIYELINILPPSITHLSFGPPVTYPIDNFPPNLTHLSFGYSFNQQVNHLPSSVTHLTFGHLFNQTIFTLPPHLSHLTFGDQFDQPVKNLPPSLLRLTFGINFNRILYPLPNLTHLTFGKNFNMPLPILPLLSHLHFGSQYKRPLPPFLSASPLTSIILPVDYLQDISLLSSHTQITYLLPLSKELHSSTSLSFLYKPNWDPSPFHFSTSHLPLTPVDNFSFLAYSPFSIFLFSLSFSLQSTTDKIYHSKIGIYYRSSPHPPSFLDAFMDLLANFPGYFQDPNFPIYNSLSKASSSSLLFPFATHFFWNRILGKQHSSLGPPTPLFNGLLSLSLSLRYIYPIKSTAPFHDFVILPGDNVGVKK